MLLPLNQERKHVPSPLLACHSYHPPLLAMQIKTDGSNHTTTPDGLQVLQLCINPHLPKSWSYDLQNHGARKDFRRSSSPIPSPIAICSLNAAFLLTPPGCIPCCFSNVWNEKNHKGGEARHVGSSCVEVASCQVLDGGSEHPPQNVPFPDDFFHSYVTGARCGVRIREGGNTPLRKSLKCAKVWCENSVRERSQDINMTDAWFGWRAFPVGRRNANHFPLFKILRALLFYTA